MVRAQFGRRILSVVAMFIALLDLFAIAVNLLVEPGSMVSLVGLFYLIVLVYAYVVIRGRDLVIVYRFMSHRLIGEAVPDDPGYRYLFLGTVIFGVLWVVWFLLSLFGIALGVGIDIVSVLAFGIAMTGPMTVYHFAREHLQNSQYVNQRMRDSLEPIIKNKLWVRDLQGKKEYQDALTAWQNGNYEDATDHIRRYLAAYEQKLRRELGDDEYDRMVRRFSGGGR